MTGTKSDAVGGGGLWLGVAKLWFLIAGYALSIGLTHLLDAEVYGRYVVVARVIAVPNMVIIYTLLFSVSRPLAAEFEQGCPSYRALRRRGFTMAAVLGGATSVVFFLGAPAFARWLGDASLMGPLRVVAPISVIYGLYAVNLGTLNAVRRFSRQAALDIAMATMKAAFIIGMAAVGMGLAWVVGGFTLAATLSLAMSGLLVARIAPATRARGGALPSMAAFAGVLVVFTAVVNLLQSADLLILKSFADTAARSDAVGFYASALQVALIPYSLMNAVALLMFPLVASLDADEEPQKVRSYLTQTVKVSLTLLCFMSAVGSASAPQVQALLFPRAYVAAASELRLLVWGFSGYSLAVTTAWIFNSAKRSHVALALVCVPLMSVVVASFAWVPEDFTAGAARAVAVAGLAAAVASVCALWIAFRAVVPVVHLLKVAVAVAVVEGVASVWSVPTAGLTGKLLILVRLVGLAGCFVAVVAATRAFTLRELRELRHAR